MFLRTLTPKRNAPFILMDESQGLSGAESGKYPAHCRLWFQAEGNFFSFLAGLSLDHAFLWYRVCHFASTLEDVKRRRASKADGASRTRKSAGFPSSMP